MVQPLDEDPPAKSNDPVAPGLIVMLEPDVDAEITGLFPAKVRAVEVKVLEFMVEEKVVAPVTARVEDRVVAPVTVSAEERVEAPDTANVPPKVMESFKPIVAEEPNVISPPPVRLVPAETVILLLVKAELGILVRVLSDPEMDLFFKVSVVSVPTRVVVASGSVIIFGLPVGVQVKVPVGPPDWKIS